MSLNHMISWESWCTNALTVCYLPFPAFSCLYLPFPAFYLPVTCLFLPFTCLLCTFSLVAISLRTFMLMHEAIKAFPINQAIICHPVCLSINPLFVCLKLFCPCHCDSSDECMFTNITQLFRYYNQDLPSGDKDYDL